MSWEILQPVLTEMLEDSKAARKEIEKIGLEVAEATRKLMELENGLGKVATTPLTVDVAGLKNFINLELTRLKAEMEQEVQRLSHQKRFLLFPGNFNAQNFKIVFETVCKWIGILGGGFYLLSSISSLWK